MEKYDIEYSMCTATEGGKNIDDEEKARRQKNTQKRTRDLFMRETLINGRRYSNF